MNKQEFIEAVMSNCEEIGREFPSKAFAKDVVETMFDVIANELADGGEVAISGFGTFKVREAAARQGEVNGVAYSTPARMVPRFVPGSALKKMVAEG